MESISRPKTIREIADEAGVSVATVSRYLNNSDKISQNAQNKIKSIVEKYNYKPNQIAKHLSKQKTETFGLVIPDITNPFFAEISRGIEQAALERGHALIICNTMNQYRVEQRHLSDLSERRVDAIILMGGIVNDTYVPESRLDDVKKNVGQTQLIIIDGSIDGVEHSAFISDFKEGMRLVFQHLYQLGHRRISFMGGRSDVSTFVIKNDIYQQLMVDHGIENAIDIMEGGFSFQDGYHSMQRYLELRSGDTSNQPTAVICINDIFAAGVIRACHEYGVSVPAELSVVSFDNTEYCEMITPTLTSIGIQYEDLGKQVIQALLDQTEVVDQYMAMNLVERGSSGPCPNTGGGVAAAL